MCNSTFSGKQHKNVLENGSKVFFLYFSDFNHEKQHIYSKHTLFLWFYDSASLEFYLKEASLKWWHFFTTHFCTFNILCLSNMWQELCQGLGEITRNVKNLLSKYLPMTIKFQARYRWWSLSFFCFMSYSHVITFSFF